MKPLKEEKLFTVLDRAARKLSQMKVLTHKRRKWVQVSLINCGMQKFTDYVTLHEISDFTLKMTLGELGKGLPWIPIFPGRAFLIINLTRISRVTRKIYLQDGTVLLPRGVYEKLNRGHYKWVNARSKDFSERRMDKKLAVYQRGTIEHTIRKWTICILQIRGWRHDYCNHIQTMTYAAARRGSHPACIWICWMRI